MNGIDIALILVVVFLALVHWQTADPRGRAHAERLRRQLRNQGYADGFRGRATRNDDPEYRRAWRRGVEARDRITQEPASA